jgi:hypothetical protein
MVGLPCLVSQCDKLHVAGLTWAVFTRVYLESCKWPLVIFTMDQRKEQRVCPAVSGETQNGRYHPPTVLPWFSTLWLLLSPKMKLKLTMPYWYHWEDPDRISDRFKIWQKRTSRKCSTNSGHGGTGIYMREGTTSRVKAADRPYGEFCNREIDV